MAPIYRLFSLVGLAVSLALPQELPQNSRWDSLRMLDIWVRSQREAALREKLEKSNPRPAAEELEWFRDFSEFTKTHDRFLRKLQGCPETGYDIALCDPNKGRKDIKDWEKLRKLGAKLFGGK